MTALSLNKVRTTENAHHRCRLIVVSIGSGILPPVKGLTQITLIPSFETDVATLITID